MTIKEFTGYFKNAPEEKVRSFLAGAEAEEKIAGHFVTVRIISKSLIRFYKANGENLCRADLILNDMWKTLVNDWNMIFFSNPDYVTGHIGYTFHMFFLPDGKPLDIFYGNSLRYIITDIRSYSGEEESFTEGFMTAVSIPATTGLTEYSFAENIRKPLVSEKILDEKMPSVMKALAGDQKEEGFLWSGLAAELYGLAYFSEGQKPEGVILRNKKADLILQFSDSVKKEKEKKEEQKGKSPCEFILLDFTRFCGNIPYRDFLSGNYVKTVCNLFCAWADNTDLDEIKKSVTAEDITAPFTGRMPQTGLEYIPNDKVKALCRLDPVWENSFKILLANLRKLKKPEWCVLMNGTQCGEFNKIVKTVNASAVSGN